MVQLKEGKALLKPSRGRARCPSFSQKTNATRRQYFGHVTGADLQLGIGLALGRSYFILAT